VTGFVRATLETPDAREEPVVSVSDGSNVDGVRVIVAQTGTMKVTFPKRWNGLTIDRLEKLDEAHGQEISEVVAFQENGLVTNGWNFCSIATSAP
jgi:hypothetical protein